MNIGILDVNNLGDPCLKGHITHSIFISLNFLMIGVQLGLLGLLIYIGFLASQFFCAKKLPDKEKWLAHGLLFSLVVTSLSNSPFWDHTEGHWFASKISLYFPPLQANIKVGIINA
jgi:O-antigen ligase